MKLPKIAAALFAAAVLTGLTGSAFAMKPVTIVDQGSFLAGGTVVVLVAGGQAHGQGGASSNQGDAMDGVVHERSPLYDSLKSSQARDRPPPYGA